MNSFSSYNSTYGSDNKHNPWAGLASYEDPKNSERKLKFCGREDDCYDLVKLIVHNTFVTLYGKSGIGKTSLLNAGVFPELRKEQHLPLYLRLGMREDGNPQSYQSIILDVIKESVYNIETINVVDEQQDELSVDYLWNFFVRHQFHDENNEQVTLVLVFDQFEEVLRSANRDDADILLRQLDYVNNNEHSFDNYEIDGCPYHYKQNCRFVVSIREDYLYRLEDGIDKNYLPSLKRCRYRLLPLSIEQAESIIVEPMPNLISLEVAKEIIFKVTGTTSSKIESSLVREKEVEPVLLSLFLSELYKRKSEGCNTIDKSLVEQFGDNIIQDFYIQTMSDISEDFVKELEDVLITSDGKRNNVFESSLVCCKNTPETTDPIKSQELNWLKEQRIIREFPWNGAIRIEFVHDVLCDTIVRRKKERELVALRAEEDRLRKRKYRNIMVLFVAAFFLLTMFLLIRTNITERKYSNALQSQIEITERKNDSLLTLIKLNEAQKDLIQTNINAITLKLNFKVGSDVIFEDSTTLAELNKLIEQIRSFDGDILSIVIEHSASPEGNLNTNMALARRRADVVNAFLRPYLGDIPTSISVNMHTWFDVAKLLCKEGFIEESNAVAQAIIDSEGSIYQQSILIKQLPFYNSRIKATILPQLRTTTCKFVLK